MGNLWLKIRIWLKVLLITLLVLYAIFFTYNNAREEVHIWYWVHKQPQTNVLLVMLFTFLAGIVGAVLVRTTFRTIRQVQDLKGRTRSARLDRDIAEMKTKASMLQTKSSPPDKPAPPPIEPLESRRQP